MKYLILIARIVRCEWMRLIAPKEQPDEWDTIMAGNTCVAQGYRCQKCGVIGKGTKQCHCNNNSK